MTRMKTRLTPPQRLLVEKNKGLAETIARDYLARAPGLDLEEVVAAAYQGLIDAALAFDESKGVPFGSYARQMIHWAIKLWQRQEDYLERNVRADYKRMQAAGYTERTVVDQAFGDQAGLTVKRMQTVVRAVSARPTSTENYVDAEAMFAHPEVDVESSALASALQGSVALAVQSLPAIQQVILALHYFEGLELRQIAQMLETSVSAVRVAHSEAVTVVHAEMVRQARQQS